MGDRTGVSWTQTRHADGSITKGASWNPVSGCTKLTAECKHCYVERDWHRLTHLPAYEGREFTDVACHEERLDQPLHWQRARRIFVCSTADLFHDDVPDEFLDRVFGVISLCPQHIFQVLTKRAGRMLAYLSAPGRREAIAKAAAEFQAKNPLDWVRADGGVAPDRGGDPNEGSEWLPRWPLPNVHVGVTAGTQESANERIPLLLETPAAVRWVSAEPLLGRLDVSRWTVKEFAALDDEDTLDAPDGAVIDGMERVGDRWIRRIGIDWLVCGGESGSRKKARPMHPQWALDLRDQCFQDGVAFFFKQQGEWIPGREATNDQLNDPKVWGCWVNVYDGKTHDGSDLLAFRDGDENMLYVGKHAAGDLLDGMEIKQWPLAA